MSIKSIYNYINYLKLKDDERLVKDLPLFPVTTDELVEFLEHKRHESSLESILGVLDNLARLPEHGDKWIKSVVRQERVLKLLESYRAYRKHCPDFIRQRFTDKMIKRRTQKWQKAYKGNKAIAEFIASSKRANRIKTPTEYDITAVINGITYQSSSTKSNISQSSSSTGHPSSSLSTTSPSSNPHPTRHKAAGFFVYEERSLLAQTRPEQLQEDMSKYKTIKLDMADFPSHVVSLVPHPSLYDSHDFS
ncbi:hypothetical protein LRAMOSA04508 [Lichtheimia ramosa]|uniref:Uncharacterized protein n=1 Tax=Lichtheimia ramosa TaxID=688394 RepID=A0A077WZ51_9FUNG|nr:hypothetical protein LRAMOSA04508 [Lichtheimia ramosa]